MESLHSRPDNTENLGESNIKPLGTGTFQSSIDIAFLIKVPE